MQDGATIPTGQTTISMIQQVAIVPMKRVVHVVAELKILEQVAIVPLKRVANVVVVFKTIPSL